MKVLGYSERGLINSLFFEIKYAKNCALLLSQLLSLAHFPGGKKNFQIENEPLLLLEQSFSDFGDADAILLLDNEVSRQSIFFEAKVKTYGKKWSIELEFKEFDDGIKSKVSSSNLFMQLYLKQILIKELRDNKMNDLQTKGVPFPAWSSKNQRKLGNNSVVAKAAKILKRYSQSSHFIAIGPDNAKSVGCFFEQELRNYPRIKIENWNTDDWGFITWEEINCFCKISGLKETLRAFRHNEGQIY